MIAQLIRTGVLASVLLLAACGGSNTPVNNNELLDELKALRAEVHTLSEEVAVLKKTPAAPGRAQLPPTRTQVPVPTAGYPGKGKLDAPVTIVEFSDFQCPFCARHSTQTLPVLERNYINTGKLRYVFMDNPIPSHRQAAKAAEAAHCAGEQDKYWEMHRTIFGNQHRVRNSAFADFATELGLDADAFKTCLDSGRNAAKVEVSRKLAATIGARATPTFVVGKTGPNGLVSGELIIGAKSYGNFAAAIDGLLKTGS